MTPNDIETVADLMAAFGKTQLAQQAEIAVLRHVASAAITEGLLARPDPLAALDRLRRRTIDKAAAQQLPDALREPMEALLAKIEAAVTAGG